MVSIYILILLTASIIAYGFISSGKTRNLYGIREESGIVPLLIQEIISQSQSVGIVSIFHDIA